MKRFQSPLSRVLRLRTQELQLSKLVLAQQQALRSEVEAEAERAAAAAAADASSLESRLQAAVSAGCLQAGGACLEANQTLIQQIRQRQVAAEQAVLDALGDLREKTRREDAVAELVRRQRVEHRREAFREQQVALDDFSSQRWHRAASNSRSGGE
jgi:flagellar export protein FliJ